MPLTIVRNDLTKMNVDAIVNAANTALKMDGGVGGALLAAEGGEMLQKECDSIGYCHVGGAVITSGGNLQAKYIIHTVSPVWRGGGAGEADLLKNCYLNSLALARQHRLRSIAFPLLSSGLYGYPKDLALQAAIVSIGEFLLKHEMAVYLVVYDKASFAMSEKMFTAIEKYIDDHYVETHLLEGFRERRGRYYAEKSIEEDEPVCVCAPMPAQIKKRNLEDLVSQLDESFSQMLLRLIDEKGRTDVEIYKKANIDRKLFSKIRSNKEYRPSKATALALAIGLELNLDETLGLLGRAGYALSHSNKFDVIIEYFIENGNYNIYQINEALFEYDQDMLGA